MRASEFITEAKFGAAEDVPANASKLPKSQQSAMKGMISMPDISQTKQGGSPYAQWRFGIAMAGAPDYPTEPAGAFAGDPLLATYTDVEMKIINSAAKMLQMSGGQYHCPIVFRGGNGTAGQLAATHSQSFEAFMLMYLV